ncbi:MAG: hypothetical protein JWO10_842 [Microbacteriaceae bacterium]|nr:hypothetical protein [Microbacteriaceae bacterium]
MSRLQIATAVAAALAVPVALTGCVGVPDDTVKEHIATAIVSEAPKATGAVVGLGYDGSPDRRTIRVKVYAEASDPASVAAVVDKAMELAWSLSPSEPVSVGIAVVDGAKPAGADIAASDGLDLSAAGDVLGLGGAYVSPRLINFPTRELVSRYGAWKAPK